MLRRVDKERVFTLFSKDFRILLRNKRHVGMFVALWIIAGLFFPYTLHLSLEGISFFTPQTIQIAEKLPTEIIPPEYMEDYWKRITYGLYQYILPLVIPLLTAASVVAAMVDITIRERERKTIERLLSLPYSRAEILTAKILASFVFSCIAAFLMTSSFLLTTWIITGMTPGWHWVTFIILIPSYLLFAICIAMFVSWKIKDYRMATQSTTLLALAPILFLFTTQWLGILTIEPTTLLNFSLSLGAMDILLLFLIYALFDFESFLIQ